MLAGCGGERERLSVERSDGHVVVELSGIRFQPDEIVVAPGTQVVFVNGDRLTHNVVIDGTEDSDSSRTQSPLMRYEDEWDIVFTEEGVYDIRCTVNAHDRIGMVGKIIVRAPSES